MTAAMDAPRHVPVLLGATLEYLVPPSPDCLMVDATQGLAGHSLAFLERYPGLRIVGVDADVEVQAIARARLAPYCDRVSFVHSFFDDYFSGLKSALESGSGERPSLVLFDFGVSMFHFRESGRGFSLQGDEPLDMRLDPSTGRSARDLVNELDERELAAVLERYGEEPFARQIAKAVARERAASPLETTGRLADIVRGAVPAKLRYGRIHPATRSFQALRIAVNDELGRIERALDAAVACLAPGGLLGAISFHSLEDRIVKLAFKEKAVVRERGYRGKGVIKEEGERFKAAPVSPISEGKDARGLIVVTKKPVEPGDDEVSANPASRSAKFRVARAVGGAGS